MKLVIILVLLLIILIINNYSNIDYFNTDNIEVLREYRKCRFVRNKVACIKEKKVKNYNKHKIERLPFKKPIDYQLYKNVKHLFPQKKPNRFKFI
jgi:hypothetical protein